ncbi:4'-phosphopantetheinyl transferase superfamily protein [Kitasatospora sp. NPDC036755]|uniref:4'-phosphopantetheinyl transferase family protein n=1 Tax=Kitasatospora sp. NPDC036755 TaxID=3154600 RepID=UPI0033CE9919
MSTTVSPRPAGQVRAGLPVAGTPCRRPADGVWTADGPLDHWAAVAPDRADLDAARALAPRRAEEFLAGRALLRRLLTALLPELATSPVVREPRGRPVLAAAPGVGISVSHDGDRVAAAVAPGRRVGVDLQQVPDEVSSRLLRRCLRERAAALAPWPAGRRAAELAWVWTVQEACVKAEGTGLAGLPWRIDVPVGAERGRWRGLRWISLRGRSAVPLSCAYSDPGADPTARDLMIREPGARDPRTFDPRTFDLETPCT